MVIFVKIALGNNSTSIQNSKCKSNNYFFKQQNKNVHNIANNLKAIIKIKPTLFEFPN
jgi:hypothetical protein